MGAVAIAVIAIITFLMGAAFGWELHSLWRSAIVVVVFVGVAVVFGVVLIRHLAFKPRRWFQP